MSLCVVLGRSCVMSVKSFARMLAWRRASLTIMYSSCDGVRDSFRVLIFFRNHTIESLIHTFIHSYIQSLIHTLTQSHIDSHIHTFTQSHIHTITHSHIHSHIHTFRHSHIHTFTHSHINV